MYCACCGRNVDEGDLKCPYCGKRTSNAPHPFVATFTRTILFPALMLLLFFLVKDLAPGIGQERYPYFAIFAVAIAAPAALVMKLFSHMQTRRSVVALILIPALLLLTVSALRGIYTIKYAAAQAEVPSSGIVRVRFDYEDEYLNDTGTGYVTNWNAQISVNEKDVGNGGFTEVELFRQIEVAGVSTFDSDGKSYLATGEITAVLTPGSLKSGREFSVLCDTGKRQYCEITITATYEPGFWDVIFH